MPVPYMEKQISKAHNFHRTLDYVVVVVAVPRWVLYVTSFRLLLRKENGRTNNLRHTFEIYPPYR